MKPFNKLNPFSIRWREPLGKPECPYMYRWVFNLVLFSVRIHHWIRSDDKRYMHNHPWSFITFVVRGSYTDVSLKDGKEIRQLLKAPSVQYRNAQHLHFVEMDGKTECWSIVLTGPQSNKWGFWINNRIMRPLRFFSRYGHPPCSEN